MGSSITNTSLSVYFRIIQILRQNGWMIVNPGTPMAVVTGQTYAPATATHAWVYMDDNGNPWPSGVVVYDGGRALGSGEFSVNYLQNQVTLAAAPSGQVTADLTCLAIGVQEGYPDEVALKDAELPLVSYEFVDEGATAFAIGTAIEWREQHVDVDMLTRNDGEKKDLLDSIRRNIKWLPLLDMSQHQYLDQNGLLDPDFDWNGQFQTFAIFKHLPRGSFIPFQGFMSHKEKFHGLVTFTCNKVE
jgi:hypothetical protein